MFSEKYLFNACLVKLKYFHHSGILKILFVYYCVSVQTLILLQDVSSRSNWEWTLFGAWIMCLIAIGAVYVISYCYQEWSYVICKLTSDIELTSCFNLCILNLNEHFSYFLCIALILIILIASIILFFTLIPRLFPKYL
jgi:hypothetical protein